MNIELREVTFDDLGERSIKRLRDWRRKNKFAYVGDYQVTYESISKWLKEYVLDNPERMLYWVRVNKRYIGHVGLNHMLKNSVEVDNVSRGVHKYKGAMSEALKFLMALHGGKRIWLRVLPDNLHAIEFYEKLGFKKKRKSGVYLVMQYE